MEKENQNELLEAALRLADLAERNTDDTDEWNAAIAAVRKHRPAPKLVEGFVAVRSDGTIGSLYRSREHCEGNEKYSDPAIRVVHVREVTDPPKWERWGVETYHDKSQCVVMNGCVRISVMSGYANRIAEAHNAEMKRMERAWRGEA